MNLASKFASLPEEPSIQTKKTRPMETGFGFVESGRVPIHHDKLHQEPTEADALEEFKLALAETTAELHASILPPIDRRRSKSYATQTGRNFLASALVLQPNILPPDFNASDLADLVCVTRQAISTACSKVTERFGVTATFQRSKEVREIYRQSQKRKAMSSLHRTPPNQITGNNHDEATSDNEN